MIGTVAGGAQVAISATALLFGGWWTGLSLLALRQPRSLGRGTVPLRWAVIVPAHDEELLIERTIGSLVASGLSADVVYVVADNCSDTTADRARAIGASVLERSNPLERGKSYALQFGLAHLRSLQVTPEAVAIVDADSDVSSGFFDAVGRRIVSGADIVQCHYKAGDGSTPVTRLRRLALSLVHWSRPLGAARLGLPTTLKGNGMAFRWDVIKDGFPGGGITEDAAATLEFARSGQVVEFEPNATVTGLMASSYKEAAVQDLRWEGGRLAMTRQSLALALNLALRGRFRASAACLELASPPLTIVGLLSAGGLSLAIAGVGSAALAVIAACSVGTYVIVGLAAARVPSTDLFALMHAPRFVIHKLSVYVRLTRGQPKSWQRTSR